MLEHTRLRPSSPPPPPLPHPLRPSHICHGRAFAARPWPPLQKPIAPSTSSSAARTRATHSGTSRHSERLAGGWAGGLRPVSTIAMISTPQWCPAQTADTWCDAKAFVALAADTLGHPAAPHQLPTAVPALATRPSPPLPPRRRYPIQPGIVTMGGFFTNIEASRGHAHALPGMEASGPCLEMGLGSQGSQGGLDVGKWLQRGQTDFLLGPRSLRLLRG